MEQHPEGQADIEITPEMVRAGVKAMQGHDPGYDLSENLVREILIDALLARKKTGK